MSREGGSEHGGACVVEGCGAAVVDVAGGEQADAGMPVGFVVPGEEASAESAGVLDGAEALGKVGPVRERLEL